MFKATVLIACSVGLAAPPAGTPPTPTFAADGKPVVREGRLMFIHLSDDYKCYDGVRRPVMWLSYFTFTDAETRYGLAATRGKNRTMVIINGKHFLPEEAQTYVADNAKAGLAYQLILTEAGKDDHPFLSWWRLEITGPKPLRRD